MARRRRHRVAVAGHLGSTRAWPSGRSWYWSEHTGQTSAQQFFDRYYATNAGNTGFWDPPPGDPGGAANIFAWSIHERGAMTL